ncbi:MAG: CBS domain-containing protein [Syntrophobacteraceae bacterium]
MPQGTLRTNGEEVAFFYLSDLLGKKVYDAQGKFLGKLTDLVTRVHDRYPEVEGITLSKAGAKTSFLVQGADCLSLASGKKHSISGTESERIQPTAHHFFVRTALYDKQILDVNGAKVERVNDVRILSCGGKTYIVNVDVGFTGLLRRLGFETPLRRLAAITGREVKDRLIDWKFVQPLPETANGPIGIRLRQEQIRQLHAGELADILEELDRDERITLVEAMGAEDAADALEETDISVQTSILQEISTELAADILEEMEPAVAADVMEKLPAGAQQSILAAMEATDRLSIERLVQAESDTAASLMTVDFIACPEAFTSAMALNLLKENAGEIDSITYIYCKDDRCHLKGVVSLRELLLSDPDTPLVEIMNTRLAVLNPEDDLQSVAEQFLKYRFKAFPVIDESGRMQGIVTLVHSFDELVPYYHKLLKKA